MPSGELGARPPQEAQAPKNEVQAVRTEEHDPGGRRPGLEPRIDAPEDAAGARSVVAPEERRARPIDEQGHEAESDREQDPGQPQLPGPAAGKPQTTINLRKTHTASL